MLLRRPHFSALTVLLLLSVLPGLVLLDAPLLLDERVLFYEARKFIALDPLAPWQLPLGGSGTWRPLLTYLYWCDAVSPAWLNHGLNLALHGVLVVLAWLWLRCRLEPDAAFVAAALFACHPAHVANAGWVAGRADLLMTLFVVAALLAWERSQLLLCMLCAGVAVLCKETGVVVLPMLLAVAMADADGRRLATRRLALLAGTVLPLFALSVSLARVDSSYWPASSTLSAGSLALLPLYFVELLAPFFRPIGVGAGLRDLLGLFLALPVVGLFCYLGQRSEGSRSWQLGLVLVALALLPVFHVLPNDGGQWYLLLPSLGAVLAWGGLAEQGLPRRRLWLALLLLFAAFAVWESSQWRKASFEVDEVVAKARLVAAEHGREAVVEPSEQEPRNWPHMGPSFCCGLPYQVLEELPGR